MTAPIVQADYDQLQEIATRFQTQSESTEQMTATLRQLTESLHAGGWIGRGSDAFHTEMTGEVLPAMVRLFEALQQSSIATQEISQQIQDAEEEAAAPFQPEPVDAIDAGGAGALPPDGAGGAPGAGSPGAGTPAPGSGPPGTGTPGGPPGTGGASGLAMPGDTRQRTGLDTGSASSLGGKAVPGDKMPDFVPDRFDEPRTLADREGSWVRNQTTGEWERQPYPDDKPPGPVQFEAVLYENKDLLLYGDSVLGGEIEGSYGRLSGDILGYETQGQVKVAVNARDGLVASGSLSGEAYLARAEYGGQFGPEIANVEAKADVLVGGQASVNGQAVINRSNAYISAGGEAFAGVTASGEIKGNVGEYGSVGANGKVGAGIGAEGKFDFGYRDGTFRLDAKVGAYLGIGASGGFTVEIKPVEIVQDIGSGLSRAGGWIGNKLGW